MVGQAVRDLRHAARAIARMPGMAAVVIGSLAVGIAANTIVFSWVQAVVFKPIPGVSIASRLHLVEPRSEAGLYIGVSWPEYRDLRERLRSMEGLLAFRMIPLYIGESGRVERSTGLLVSDNYFTGLALTPALGRFLRADEVEQPGTAPVVVISYDYWQTRFSGSPAALGQVDARERGRSDDCRRHPARIQGHGDAARVRFLAAGDARSDGAERLAGARRSRHSRLHRDRHARPGAYAPRRRRPTSTRRCDSWRRPSRRPTARCRESFCRTGNRRAGRSG